MSGLLDDLEGMRSLDKSSMLQQIIGLPDHLSSALGGSVNLEAIPDGVVVCGMGGSAVGGDILADYAVSSAKIPMVVVRGVELPLWVGKKSLVVMVSYSGNTWEVLDLYHSAKERDCKMAAVTSGGKLAELCQDDQVPVVKVPSGLQPRGVRAPRLPDAYHPERLPRG